MPNVKIIEPNISSEESEENLKEIIKVLERIAQEIVEREYTQELEGTMKAQ